MLHKGTRIRSGINLSSLIGILTGPVDLYSKDLIISRTSSEKHVQLEMHN